MPIINSMKKSNFLFATLIFLFIQNIFSQTPDFQNKIRIPLWAELDAYPELKEAQDTNAGQFDYSTKRIKQTSEFLLNGMTYGWNFEYTPYDKTRGVDEYLSVTPINTISDLSQIVYTKPWIQDNKIYCWVEFSRSPEMIANLRAWKSIKTQKIKGRGQAKISLGFDGIIQASNNAVKNAIRNHYRQYIKNKPKVINGRVIIKDEPKIGIISGQYTVELDFFLESNRILMYEQF